MKYIIILLSLFITIPALASYWGGKISSVSSMKRDYCPDGDFSKSQYDNTCGKINQNVINKAQAKINFLIPLWKYTPIQLFRISERALAKKKSTTNPYHKLICDMIIKRVSQVI